MLVAPLPAQAAVGTCTVTTGSDDVSSAPDGSLRACSLLLGGSGFEDGINVSFQVDSILLAGPIVFTSPVGALVTLTGPVAIEPNDGFSSSGGRDRLLVFQNGDVALDSLEVSNALHGAIYARDNYLLVSNSDFSGNETDGSSLHNQGAAINHEGEVLVVENSTFTNNVTTGDAGAIEAGGALVIKDSHFRGNRSLSEGGAISADKHSMIVRSSFVQNRSEAGDGGAIHGGGDDDGWSTFVAFSTFLENYSGSEGGAIYDEDDDGGTFIAFNTFVNDEGVDGQSGQSFDSENEDVYALGNIFANESSAYLYEYEDDFLDFGGNFSTSEEGDLYDPRSADLVSLQDLALGELTEFENETFGFIPSSGSVAGGLIDEIEWLEYLNEFDSVTSQAFNLDAILTNNNGSFVDQSNNEITEPYSAGSVDFNAELQPVPYLGPVVTNDPETAQSGSTVTYTGSDLDEVTSATIAGQSAAIVAKSASSLTLRVPAGLTQGMHDVILHYSTTESLTLQNGLVVQDLMKVWTQLQSDNTVKMYAKNIVGEGKIQFFHNNNEIAWVRASNALNPKLRQANGSSYLVRTRELVEGKNAFEIHQDGKRIWRAAYSN